MGSPPARGTARLAWLYVMQLASIPVRTELQLRPNPQITRPPIQRRPLIRNRIPTRPQRRPQQGIEVRLPDVGEIDGIEKNRHLAQPQFSQRVELEIPRRESAVGIELHRLSSRIADFEPDPPTSAFWVYALSFDSLSLVSGTLGQVAEARR